MPCRCEPGVTTEEWLEYLVCQCCRLLDIDEIKSIAGLDLYYDLVSFYGEHLYRDYESNFFDKEEREKYEAEAKRLGWHFTYDSGIICLKMHNKSITGTLE